VSVGEIKVIIFAMNATGSEVTGDVFDDFRVVPDLGGGPSQLDSMQWENYVRGALTWKKSDCLFRH